MLAYDLRCEYLRNPMGIDMPAPRFFWKLKGSLCRGAVQKERRVVVADNELFDPVHWDSSKLENSNSTQVEYCGAALNPRTRYFWRVQAWDGNGHSAGWSEAAWFETGLMNEGWQARWISAEANSEVCPILRREFSVGSQVQSARIYATARGVYRLWLNGKAVGDWLMTPGWTAYAKRLQYQTYDVTGLLQAGDNAIGAMLGRGWHSGELGWEPKQVVSKPPRELLLELHITYIDGSQCVMTSDGHWMAADGPVLISEIYHGEVYDARKEVDAWSEPGKPAGCWRAVHVAPEGGWGAVTAQDGLPVRRIEEITPKALLKTPKGEVVLDMGQNMVGFVRLRVSGKAGSRVVLKHFEVLDAQGNVYMDNLRSARQTIEYTLKGRAEETYEPYFSFQGFRYVQIERWPGEPELSSFTGVVAHSDMEPTGSFCCNDELVNKLQHNIIWGQKGNFFDVPTDCPQRDERMGWTGDAQAFVSTACFNYMSATFYTKWLRDMAAEQLADGGIPFVIPSAIAGSSSSAWADAATICPWTIYEYYGDKRLLEECYPMMKHWVEYIRAQGDNELLWNTGFHFGDWLALDAGSNSFTGVTDKDLIATAFYALSASLLARAAAALGYAGDAEKYGQLSKHIRMAFREEFVTPNGRIACSTQTAQVLGLHFGLVDEHTRGRAAGTLKALIEERGGHLSTGFVGTTYLCHALTESGMHQEACDLIMKKDCPSWLYPITQGATTIWEHWDGIKPDGSFWTPGMNSFNHYAYGSIGDWLYKHILGIAPDGSAPGFRNVIVSPKPCGAFTEAAGSFMSLYGKVSVSWRLAAGLFEMELTLPENTTATVLLPGAKSNSVLESGKPIEEAEGITRIRRSDEGTMLTAGSGTYQFWYQFAE